MAFLQINQYNSPNYTAGAQSRSVFGYDRTIRHIVIHQWDDKRKNPTFNGTINWLCNPESKVSAHAVVEAGRAAFLVNPWDVAWGAGNAQGNAQGLQIECNPRASDADYETVAEVIALYREINGDLLITTHNYWTWTLCPGDWDVFRLDKRAYEIGRKKYGRPFGV